MNNVAIKGEQSPTPKTGFFKMSAEAYHALPYVSASRLKLLAKSPAHLKYSLENPTAQTEAMRFGELVHTAILETDRFLNSIAVAPKVDRRTSIGKKAWEDFQVENVGKIVIGAGELKQVEAIVESVKQHRVASLLVDKSKNKEVSCVAQHSSGMILKARIDAIVRSASTVFDLKTTTDASPQGFSKAIYQYGYHVQGAFYLEVLKLLGMPLEHVCFIAVEKEAPYNVAVYRLSKEALELGRKQAEKLILKWQECERLNKWEGYGEGVLEISLPSWGTKEIENYLGE